MMSIIGLKSLDYCYVSSRCTLPPYVSILQTVEEFSPMSPAARAFIPSISELRSRSSISSIFVIWGSKRCRDYSRSRYNRFFYTRPNWDLCVSNVHLIGILSTRILLCLPSLKCLLPLFILVKNNTITWPLNNIIRSPDNNRRTIARSIKIQQAHNWVLPLLIRLTRDPWLFEIFSAGMRARGHSCTKVETYTKNEDPMAHRTGSERWAGITATMWHQYTQGVFDKIGES